MEIRKFTARNGTVLPFTVLGFGTAPLGDLFEKLDEKQTVATVEAAYQSGIRIFDTSPHYGNGLAESRLGTGLRQATRSDYLMSTKVGRVMNPFARPAADRSDVISPGFAGGFPHAARFDYSYDGTMRSIEHSLLRMGLDRLDIVLIHDCDRWTHGPDADLRFKEAMDGAYQALDKLRSEKVVGAIGVGINEADTCVKFGKAGDFDVTMMAGRYSLLDQSGLEEFLPLAEQKKMGILLAGVFNSGILATGAIPNAKYDYSNASPELLEKVRKMEAVCKAHGTTIRRAALQFALGHPAVVAAVLGGVKPEEVISNAKDLNEKVPADLWSELKAQKLLPAHVPVPN